MPFTRFMSQASVGGDPQFFAGNPTAKSGLNAIRLFEPCTAPDGTGCTLFENPDDPRFNLATPRWYTSSLRIFDGSIMIVGMPAQRPVFNVTVFVI